MPSSARRILDVGCGTGLFASRLKKKLSAEVWGIELEPEAAALASPRLDRVLAGDVLNLFGKLPKGAFDCIVLNDILEHLVEPEALLVGLRSKLAADGRLVASIPNVRYFPNLWELVIRGRWEYSDEGILDRTHLRFFTRRSMVKLFERCGYRLQSMTGIHATCSWKFRLVNILTLGRWWDMKYLQFACVADVISLEPEAR